MSWTPTIKKAFNLVELNKYINDLSFNAWKPSLIVWHNTALPTIAQWEKSYQADLKAGLEPGITRINSLENFFKNNQGWPSGPHFFVYKDKVWAFTPANKKGTHSPSWNGIAIGIEMIADFSKEDDDSGIGLLIKNNTIALTAMLCEKLNLNPEVAVKLHKEDSKTTHDCPGHNIAVDKQLMIGSVLEYMGHGGEHVGDIELVTPKTRSGIVTTDGLNVRDKSSASAKAITSLKASSKVTILNEAMNGNTKWFYIGTGWVAAKFIKEV
jgi:N-acetylmuramoyl-L-alanine amidase CwlA